MPIKKIKETVTGENVKELWDESNIKLTKIEKAELTKLNSKKELKFLVDQYKQAQDYRITTENQARSIMQGFDKTTGNHPTFIQRSLQAAAAQEQLYKKYLDIATDAIPICKWMKAIKGIGPVFAATLYASFDVTKGSYATDFLSYAGLNDNNNPWLGTAKAKSIVSEIEGRFNVLATKVRNEFDIAVFGDAVSKTSIAMLKSFNAKIKIAVKKNPQISLDEIMDIVNGIRESKGLEDLCVPTSIENIEILPDVLVRLSHPAHIGMWHYAEVHKVTKRKIGNIKHGTMVCAAGNSKDANPDAVTNCTLVNLEAYLAKPPYNTDLKKVMYLIGEAFMKVSNRGSLYGEIYAARKADEQQKNEAGLYKEQAKSMLASKKYAENTDTYKALSAGKLADGHITMRAKRYAVKLFISHVYEAMYCDQFHEDAPRAYVIEHQGHHDYIPPEVDFRPYIDESK